MTYFSKTLSDIQPHGIYRSNLYKQGADDPQGKKALNTYVCEYGRSWSPSSLFTADADHGGGTMYSNWCESYREPYIFGGEFLNRLYSKAAEAVRGHDFNAGLAAVEAKESLQTVVQTVQFFYRAAKSAKNGDWSGFGYAYRDWQTGRKTYTWTGNSGLTPKGRTYKGWKETPTPPVRAGDIPGSILNINLALMPMISDIRSAWEAFTRVVTTETRFVVRHGFRESGDIGNFRRTYIPSLGYMRTDTVVHGQLILYLQQSLSQLDSLGLTDVPSMLWEKLMLSWMIDYVINVGQFLQNIHFYRMASYTYCQTLHYKRSDRFIRTGTPDNTWGPYPFQPTIGGVSDNKAGLTGVYGRLDRTHGSSLPIPFPGLKSFGRAATPTHVLNAGSLILSRMASLHQDARHGTI